MCEVLLKGMAQYRLRTTSDGRRVSNSLAGPGPIVCPEPAFVELREAKNRARVGQRDQSGHPGAGGLADGLSRLREGNLPTQRHSQGDLARVLSPVGRQL